MNTFKGFPLSIRKLTITILVILLIVAVIILLVPNFILRVFLLALTLPFIHLSYIGMITKIEVDDEMIRVYRPAHVQRIRISDIAFCAVHGLDDGKALVYCFTRQRFLGRDGVHGIRSKEGYDQIVKRLMADEGNFQTDVDINFHRAKKIPVSFVEDSERLKDLILKSVDLYHITHYRVKI